MSQVNYCQDSGTLSVTTFEPDVSNVTDHFVCVFSVIAPYLAFTPFESAPRPPVPDPEFRSRESETSESSR